MRLYSVNKNIWKKVDQTIIYLYYYILLEIGMNCHVSSNILDKFLTVCFSYRSDFIELMMESRINV